VRTRVIFYRESDGTVPILEWFDTLPDAVQDKCQVALERLRELGRTLRRPEADYLRDGIYELRTKRGRVNYRILYFFHRNVAAVVSHGVVKEDRVPAKAIDWARERKRRFEADPALHTYEQKGR
jgi:phage-related protein